ncbi:MAG TPA: GDSL-type esterase/lipase family protein [Lachnospiraceae bacterium]|nr:GDSL-type esterase/lipase family protein [Lachnospiraceae bacterium]
MIVFRKQNKIILFSLLSLVTIVIIFIGILIYPYHSKFPVVDSSKINVACIGDSITYGSGVKDSRDKDSYPVQLNKMLGEDYQVLNYGASGRTLQDIGAKPYRKTGFIGATLEANPEYVIIMLGTNDSKPCNWNAEQYRSQYIALIHQYQALKNDPKIYIMTPPAAFVMEGEEAVIHSIDPEVIRNEIRQIVTDIAKQTDVTLIDIYSIMEDHPEYFVDGVHPGKYGNHVLAETIYQALRSE